MMRLILLVIIGVILIGIDVMCLDGLHEIDHSRPSILRMSYVGLYIILFYVALVVTLLLRSRARQPRSTSFNIAGGLSFSIFISKVIMFIGFGLLNMADWIFMLFDGRLNQSWWLSIVILSLILLLILIFGIFFGKYRYKVERISLTFNNLPQELSGLKIVQISDVHSGTWDHIDKVAKGLKIIQEQGADLILFTGDLINSHKDEIDPFIDLFADLTAPLGKYAVLGNHDYVGIPRRREDRSQYWDELLGKFDTMGFSLLLNENVVIKHRGASFSLIGVENWGDGRFFPKRGDLDVALNGVSSQAFTVLMSHDPSHWDKKVITHPRHIDLTLSGHTHGMQFGVNFKSFKWSPVQYRYKYWIGLYQELGQYLYVNRGLGLLAFPGRVGMWPEISVLTLISANKT